MSLQSRITAVVQHIATQLKNIKLKQWDLTTLTTTEKSTLVWALNELSNTIASATSIDDTATNTNTTATYSANKIHTIVNTAISNLVNGADVNSDTLSELADQITALAQADNGLVSAIASQSFTTTQKATARANIEAVSTTDIGSTSRDFVVDFDTVYNA